MKLQDLYKKDITREVNPAVSVTSEDAHTVSVEIEEYVFTDMIINTIYELLDTIRRTHREEKGIMVPIHSHTGIWIDGYYGSGKSHLLKYLNYCANPQTTDRAMGRLMDAIEEIDPMDCNHDIKPKRDDLQQMADWLKQAKIDTCSINLLTHSDDRNRELKDTFLSIFWQQFNKMRGYNDCEFALAQHLEKALDEEGVLEQWHKNLAAKNYDIKKAGIPSMLAARRLSVAIDEAKLLAPSLDYDAIRSRIMNPRDVVSVDTFAQELKEYLDKQPEGGKNNRILFLADEVSIFINNNLSVLGQLQELVTRVGELTDNRVWILCTAQQNLEHVIKGCKVQETQDEYGKIMGRFEVRKSLESTSAKYITQQRILEKKPEVVDMLSKLYKEKKTALDNQYNLPVGFSKFDSADTFVGYYPFVPFQLDLVLKVFEGFQEQGYVMREVSDTQRSIIRVTHATAKSTAQEEVGRFMSFDQFYNTMFQNSLQAVGSKAIGNAIDVINDGYSDKQFGQRVVNVLFMICNMLEKDRRVFPATLDNLTILLMDDIDANKQALRERISKVTQYLEEHHIIRKEKTDNNTEFFAFFTEEQREVARSIDSQKVDVDFMAQELTEAFFPKMFGAPKNKEHFMNRDLSMRYCVYGAYKYNGTDTIVDFCIETSHSDLSAHLMFSAVPQNQLTFFLAPQIQANEEFWKAFQWYCKVQKYCKNSSSTDQRLVPIIQTFKERSNALHREVIMPELEQMFNTCEVATGNQILPPAVLGSSRTLERYNKALQQHFNSLFFKASLANGSEMPKSMLHLKQLITRPVEEDEYLNVPMTEAENEVQGYIVRTLAMHEITLRDIVTFFERAPFGWNDYCTLYVVNELVRRRLYDYAHDNIKDIDTPQVAGMIESQLTHLSLRTAQVVDQKLINEFIQTWNYVFNTATGLATSDAKELCRRCREGEDEMSLDSRLTQYNAYARKAASFPFVEPLNNAIQLMSEWKRLRDPESFFQKVIEQKEQGKQVMDDSKQVINFLSETNMQRYNQVLTFIQQQEQNFDQLPAEYGESANAILAIKTDKLPKLQVYGPLMKKLDAAIKECVGTLQTQIREAYAAAYQTLYDLCDSKQIEKSFLPEESSTTEKACSSNNLFVLKSNVNTESFVANQTQRIIDEYNRRQVKNTGDGPKKKTVVTVQLQCPTQQLETEAQVDAYVANLKQQLMRKLIEGEQVVMVIK